MKSRISLLLLLILLICTISGNIFSATLEVGTGKTYSTIQTAIDAASSGDTILVYPGTYTENINLSDGITVESSGTASETIIDGNTSGTVVIMDNDSTIDGFTIQNGSGTNAGGGTYIGGGIVAYLKVNVTIQNCVITSNSITGATTAMGGGIWAQDTSNSTLSNC